MKPKQQDKENIFWGTILIVVAIVIGLFSDFLTFIVLLIGCYFVIKGLIGIEKSKKKSKKKKRR